MRTSPSSTLALPPALTYLLSRALADFRRPRRSGTPATARLGGLCRDTVRYLARAGASGAEIEAALTDAVAIVGAAPDPAVRAVLDDVTASARAAAAE